LSYLSVVIYSCIHMYVSVSIYRLERPQFAHTRQSLVLLESVSRCVQQQEPLLLVGETGVGKTALISYLASITGTYTVCLCT